MDSMIHASSLLITSYVSMGHKIGDYDVWYEACKNCGFDTAKSTKESRPRCWKCGRPISRDYSDRALKPESEWVKEGSTWVK